MAGTFTPGAKQTCALGILVHFPNSIGTSPTWVQPLRAWGFEVGTEVKIWREFVANAQSGSRSGAGQLVLCGND